LIESIYSLLVKTPVFVESIYSLWAKTPVFIESIYSLWVKTRVLIESIYSLWAETRVLMESIYYYCIKTTFSTLFKPANRFKGDLLNDNVFTVFLDLGREIDFLMIFQKKRKIA